MSEHAHDGHDHGWQRYFKLWLLLVVLAIVSWVGPEFAPSIAGAVSSDKEQIAAITKILVLFAAFGIAIYKAYLVAANFMHLNVEKTYIKYMLATMLIFMVLFFAGTSPDVMKHEGTQWTNVAAEQEIERALKAAKEEKKEGDFLKEGEFDDGPLDHE